MNAVIEVFTKRTLAKLKIIVAALAFFISTIEKSLFSLWFIKIYLSFVVEVVALATANVWTYYVLISFLTIFALHFLAKFVFPIIGIVYMKTVGTIKMLELLSTSITCY